MSQGLGSSLSAPGRPLCQTMSPHSDRAGCRTRWTVGRTEGDMRTLIQGEEYSAENGCIDNEKWCAGARAHCYEIIIQAGVPEHKITEYIRQGLTPVV